MYKIFLSLLLVVPSLLQGMAQEEATRKVSEEARRSEYKKDPDAALNKVLEIALKNEARVTPELINELEEALPYVPDINAVDEVFAFFSEQNTPLTVAAFEGNITVCRILIAHRADVNQSDKEGTPLMHVQRRASARFPYMIEFLREMGARE